MSSTAACFAPVSVETGEALKLSMQRLWLAGRMLPAGARLTVQHIFRSQEKKPIEVIYSFPLPRDAALRAFRITGEGFDVHSELKPVEDAVKAYEDGMAAGSLSALVRQYGDGIVNLTVGNVRPGETVTVYLELLAGVESRDDGYRFRFPFTLAPGYHSKMRAAVVNGEGEMDLPSDEFGDVILPRWRQDASGLHEVGFELKVIGALREIGSPSHTIRVGEGGSSVSLARDHDAPNRDLILDVKFTETAVQVLSGDAEGKRNFAAIVPSTVFGAVLDAARRVVMVLDRSGSMQGTPIAQARKAVEACLAALSDRDQFGIVAFDDHVESVSGSLMAGTRENRDKARRFLAGIDARGGTELAAGVAEATRILGGAGDVLVMTDGQVFGTEDILDKARAANVRLSCLGIGSASQDRFLSLLARETQGVSRFVTGAERVDMAAVDLFASIGRPVASGLKASEGVEPEPAGAVFAGTPVVLFGESQGAVQLDWDGGGHLDIPIPGGGAETAETVRLLRGSRIITDWESRYPKEEANAALEKRKQSRVARRLAELSAQYGLASREMALVAVVKRAGDRPGEVPETRVVPVGMPEGTQFGSYFGGGPQQAMPIMSMAIMRSAAPASPAVPFASSALGAIKRMGRVRSAKHPTASAAEFPIMMDAAAIEPPPPPSAEDKLMDLATQLEPDGGMPGGNSDERVRKSIEALMEFVRAGHTISSGAFRSHVRRLVEFLKRVGGDGTDEAIRAGCG
jgi:Ca-activated chloride channel family protein